MSPATAWTCHPEPPESTFKEKIHLTAYPTREWGGVIWTYMGPPELMPELPLFEWCQVPPSHRTVSRWIQECNYFQGMEGEMDSTHAYFLHQWFDGGQLRPAGQVSPGRQRRPAVDRISPSRGADPAAPDRIRNDPLVPCLEADGRRRWRIDRWMIPIFSLVSAACTRSAAAASSPSTTSTSPCSSTWHTPSDR